MDKERKQDLTEPDEEALEQHVHDMLDITAPEVPKTSPKPAVKTDTPKKTSKSVTVSFADHDEPAVPEKVADPELIAAIEEANSQLAGQAPATAPLVSSSKKPTVQKKVAITHLDEEPEPVVTPEPELSQPVQDTAPELNELPEDLEPITEDVAEPEVPVESADSEKSEAPKEPVTVGELMATTSPLELELESSETDKAVSDIIAAEGDALLAVQDSKTPATTTLKPKKQAGLISLFFRSSIFRWLLFLLIVAGLVGVGAYPKTRYYALNKAGVKSTASVVIIDKSTLRPLKNVAVSLAGQTATTDEEGKASLSQLPLGPTELVIQKRAFAEYKQPMTVGWGSNPLDEVSLTPQGDQYVFQISDFLSTKPLTEVEASVGELSATANEAGEITLTLDEIETDTVAVKFVAAGYKDTTYELTLSNKAPVNIVMTPAKQIVFVSKRTGKFDVYKIDVDGKNETLVVKGTGTESPDITLLPSPSDDVALLVASSDGTYSKEGILLNNLVLINLKDNSTKTIQSSTQLRAVDWIGSRLVYVMLNDDAQIDDPARYKLMSYDYKSGDNRQLATTNYFNSVISAGGKIYYAPASAYQNGINVGVFSVFADGSGKQSIFDQESWNMLRTAHDTITIASQQDWYAYKPGTEKPEKIAGQPSDTTSRVYTDSLDTKHSVWVDVRDGKGVIVLYDTATKAESVLQTQSGLTGPIRWLNNSSIIFRVTGSRETADYVMSINGGIARKVVDVTNTSGIDRWSY